MTLQRAQESYSIHEEFVVFQGQDHVLIPAACLEAIQEQIKPSVAQNQEINIKNFEIRARWPYQLHVIGAQNPM